MFNHIRHSDPQWQRDSVAWSHWSLRSRRPVTRGRVLRHVIQRWHHCGDLWHDEWSASDLCVLPLQIRGETCDVSDASPPGLLAANGKLTMNNGATSEIAMGPSAIWSTSRAKTGGFCWATCYPHAESIKVHMSYACICMRSYVCVQICANIIQSNAIDCNVRQYNAMQYNVMWCNVV